MLSAIMPTAASAMASVDSQPRALRGAPIVCSPMMRGLAAISIVTIMMGTATTPLTTALQNKALIGSIGEKLRRTPPAVAAAITR